MEERSTDLKGMKMYTLTEIEPIIGVTHRTLLEYVKNKKFPAVKICGRWRISEENLKRFLNGEV